MEVAKDLCLGQLAAPASTACRVAPDDVVNYQLFQLRVVSI
jgi:hypothetical protein